LKWGLLIANKSQQDDLRLFNIYKTTLAAQVLRVFYFAISC